ncbi:lipoyl synthase, partial [bacterium]|nr:lipoyl synthase [bacterium]
KRFLSLTGFTKSGIMVGMGETKEEITGTMKDLREVGCDIFTIGQYLQPSLNHLPISRYYSPDEFKEFQRIGEGLGFLHIESGPLVRSSYHAADIAALPLG